MHLRWRNVAKPVICAVHGYCIFGGWMVASTADIIFAADDALFLGSAFQYFSIPYDIHHRKAKEFLFQSKFIDAQQAKEMGLVNRVVPRDRLEQETLALAQRVALQDPFALRLCKASLNQMQDEMGFRTAITGAYASYALSMEQRVAQGQEFFSGSERAKRRDQAFGDHT
jgi:enoyl-CoA hydratase